MKELSYMTIQYATSDDLIKLRERADLHYENTPIQLYWKFYHQKMKIFR